MSKAKGVLTEREIRKYLEEIVENDEWAQRGAPLVRAILESDKLRVSELSHQMDGHPEANRKHINRLLRDYDPYKSLRRLYWEEAPFQIVDPSEIERSQAYNTEYVGQLPDKRRGFWLMVAATPFRGRALPFDFRTYSSRTIEADPNGSRNLEHRRLLWDLDPDTPVILDREFSYGELLEDLVETGRQFVIRLNVSSGVRMTYERGETTGTVPLKVGKGEVNAFRKVYYKGDIEVNLAGTWRRGEKEPLWVMSNLDPERALELYEQRMKIEESFRDLKDLLRIDRMMNKRQKYLDRLIAWALIAYAIGFVVGEFVRDEQYRDDKKKESELFRTLHPAAP